MKIRSLVLWMVSFICIAVIYFYSRNSILNRLNNIDEYYYKDFNNEPVNKMQISVIDAYFRDSDSFLILNLNNEDITELFYHDNIDDYEQGNYEAIKDYISKNVNSMNFEPDLIFREQQK